LLRLISFINKNGHKKAQKHKRLIGDFCAFVADTFEREVK
jgi:hypothetical protein